MKRVQIEMSMWLNHWKYVHYIQDLRQLILRYGVVMDVVDTSSLLPEEALDAREVWWASEVLDDAFTDSCRNNQVSNIAE